MNPKTNVIAMSATLAAAALLACAPVHAGKIVSESNERGMKHSEVLEFNDKGQVRVTGGGLDSLGLIVRDKRLYFFGEPKGKPKVVDVLAAMKKAQAKGRKRPETDPAVEEIAEIKPTGRKQTIAGIEGEAHTVAWVIAGKKRSEEVVLTRDPRLAPMIQGLSLDPGFLSQKPKKAELKEQVLALGAFLLKSPTSVVVSADFGPTPDERFTLKAKPTDNPDDVGAILFGAMGLSGAPAGQEDAKPAAANKAKPASKVNASSDDVKACENMPMAQCRASLVRKYGKPTKEDSQSLSWDKFRGANGCYSFNVGYGSDKKELSGYSFATASCE